MNLRVLIIDDSDDDAQLIVRALRTAGIEVDSVRVDTHPALTAALSDERGWDVIVCDHLMPGLDAARVMGLARTAMATVPILLVCGHYPMELWHELGSGLATRFVCKNQLTDLPGTIRALLQAA